MRSRMHPKYYLSDEIFEREQKKIFRKVWLFVGLKVLLTKNNSFVTRSVAGIPIVIQNFNGALHAFENVCLHRSAPLQTEAVGCRPLVCKYHSWKYGASGHVENIPRCDAIYGFGDAEKKSLKLREFALRTVGNILFINLDSNPMPFEDQFSAEFIDLLESSSNSYDTEVMVTTWHCKFNWKLAYENLRDSNHVQFVHPKSLAPYVNFEFGVDHAAAQESLNLLTETTTTALRREMRSFSYGGPEGDFSTMHRFMWHSMVERWGDRDAYFNWLAYPNLHVVTGSGGHSFSLEHHIPISPGRTDLEIYVLTARKRQPFVFSSQVLLASMLGSKNVVGEDVEIMERVQSVLHNEAPLPNQGLYESTNRRVERWYTTLMETDCEV